MFCSVLFLFGCKKEASVMVHFKVKFDPLQERLNNQGQVTTVSAGNAAQTPVLNSIAINYLEFLHNAWDKLGQGEVLMPSPEMTTTTGETAIDFSKIKMGKDGDIIFSVPLSKLPAGKYEWIRTSVPYQNIDVAFNYINVPTAGNFYNERGAMAMFTGSNMYISTYKIWTKQDSVNATKKQGYWAYETKLSPAYALYNKTLKGQLENPAFTLVNPLTAYQPVQASATIIAGKLDAPLEITGKETQDITITLTFSTNKSFEWEDDIIKNGQWDILGQANSGQKSMERIIDTGFRGMKASFETK
jgi:hypothetical protein